MLSHIMTGIEKNAYRSLTPVHSFTRMYFSYIYFALHSKLIANGAMDLIRFLLRPYTK
jgi:hypothetical protein